jgi:predicted short-subunit dehydrogenase-like oxidoreductase (DUF2520 family)
MHSIEYSIVGVGAVGSVLAAEMARSGLMPLTVIDKDLSKARRVARRLHTRATSDIKQINCASKLIVLSVSDHEIRSVASELSRAKLPWSKVTVLHTSGSRGIEVLKAVEKLGSGVAAFHPYQTFPKQAKVTSLKGVTFGIEGNSKGLRVARMLAKALGGYLVVVPAKERILYHLSAVLASGFVSSDLLLATQLLHKSGFSNKQALRAVLAIAQQTLKNIEGVGAQASITGPAMRRDSETIHRHLQALRRDFPELEKVYGEMSQLMHNLASSPKDQTKPRPSGAGAHKQRGKS